MNRKRRGRVFVISAPSGGGKTSVCKRLKEERFRIKHSLSATTRKRRTGERNGRDYFFLSRPEFMQRVRKGAFLEWTNNFGDLYGTPKRFVVDAVNKGDDVILAIDVKGAMRVKKIYKDAVLIFILPPSFADLKARLKRRRTEDKKAFRRRMEVAKREMTYLKKYDYSIINDNLARAVEVLKSVITAERSGKAG